MSVLCSIRLEHFSGPVVPRSRSVSFSPLEVERNHQMNFLLNCDHHVSLAKAVIKPAT